MPRKTELSEEDKRLREKLGASVRRLTSAQGMKPQDVARVGGVSLAHQYRIENGETTPDGLYLFKVASHLGISMDSFFADAVTTPIGALQGAAVQSGLNLHQSGSGNVQIGQQAGAIHNAGAIGFFKQQKGDKPNARKRSGKG